MTHYLYKPHVLGPKGITTPDILVDGLFRTLNTQNNVELLASGVEGISTKPELQCSFNSLQINPAYFLIAAGGGVIVSVGAECVADGSLSILVSRFAWRLKYVSDVDKLKFALSGNSVSSIEIPFKKFPLPESLLSQLSEDASTLPRGLMVCVTAADMAKQLSEPDVIEISLQDTETGKHLSHRLSLLDLDRKGSIKGPEARYAVGPTIEDVQHYI